MAVILLMLSMLNFPCSFFPNISGSLILFDFVTCVKFQIRIEKDFFGRLQVGFKMLNILFRNNRSCLAILL